MYRFLATVLVCSFFQSNAAAVDRPNIVLILADDLGIGDVGCYGGDRCQISTPNIDALAARGIRFTDAHVNASVCGPTRRALMTGRYPWRFGPTQRSGPWGFVGPKPGTETFTLGKMLRGCGYRTGYVGKWHLGTIMATVDGKTQGPTNVDYGQPLQYGPIQFGFEDSFILPGSLDMYPYAFVRNHLWQGDISVQKGWSAFHRVGPAAKDFEDHQVLETFYQEAESFIRRQKEEEPFFLYLALTAPHTPTSPGVQWRGRSELGVYGDFVMEVDHAVQRVTGALQAAGLDDDTLVIFTSDHGPAAYAGNILKSTPGQIRQLEKKGHHSNGPHRGYKFSVYEGGLRVPLIACWPGVTPAASTCDSLIGLNDLCATFASLNHLDFKVEQAPDSISFAKLLSDPDLPGDRTNLIMRSVTSFVVRDGDWKLCLCPGAGCPANSPTSVGNEPSPEQAWAEALRQHQGGLDETALLRAPFVQLFHLPDDIHEDRNLAASEPERVSQMVALLQNQISRGRSTPGSDLPNDSKILIVQPRDKRLPSAVRERLQQTK